MFREPVDGLGGTTVIGDGADAIKTRMRGRFQRCRVEELPQNQKRARVVELAFTYGIVRETDL